MNRCTLNALKHIDQLPLPLTHPLLKAYPAMKMGDARAIAFYARQLADHLSRVMDQHNHIEQWVITSPAWFMVPSAANLLAWQVYDRLKHQPDKANRVSYTKLSYMQTNLIPHSHGQDYQYYCQGSLADRVSRVEQTREREGDDEILRQHQCFDGKAVIVVNDIRVTGTQQQFMQQSFDQLPIRHLHWQYILDVDGELGRNRPDVEHQINFSTMATDEAWEKLIKKPDLIFTSKSLVRLFSYPLAAFERLLNELPESRLQQLHELTRQEGLAQSHYFGEKMPILEMLSHGVATHA